MPIEIITTDLHLTANPLDEYRWQFFPFLREKIRTLPMGVKRLYILGDVSQDKDRHPAVLVNRFVNEIVATYRAGLHDIVFLRGNHDGLGDVAFFEFLNNFPYITYVTVPKVMAVGGVGAQVALLPHTKNPKNDWAVIEFNEVSRVFAHATVSGVKAESGYTMEDKTAFDFLKNVSAKVYSGDIHVPQRIGSVEYVGAPYPIRFGDDFYSRVLVLDHDRKKTFEWHYDTINKVKASIVAVGELESYKLRPNDQLKVELHLERTEFHEWDERKRQVERWCEEREVVLCGIELVAKKKSIIKVGGQVEVGTPVQAFDRYCKESKADKRVEKVGRELLEGVVGKSRQLKLKSR